MPPNKPGTTPHCRLGPRPNQLPQRDSFHSATAPPKGQLPLSHRRPEMPGFGVPSQDGSETRAKKEVFSCVCGVVGSALSPFHMLNQLF